jgi:hypothetical protein
VGDFARRMKMHVRVLCPIFRRIPIMTRNSKLLRCAFLTREALIHDGGGRVRRGGRREKGRVENEIRLSRTVGCPKVGGTD